MVEKSFAIRKWQRLRDKAELEYDLLDHDNSGKITKEEYLLSIPGMFHPDSDEAKILRDKFPTSLLVTPGIRLQNDSVNDQKRVATPEFALSQGATHLVVGRSILKSNNPSVVVDKILRDIQQDKLNG